MLIMLYRDFNMIFFSTSCHRRWHQFLKPRSEGYKNHDWTIDEVMMLDDHNDHNFGGVSNYDERQR